MIRSMMLLSPRPRSAPANLLRLLAVWLAAIVFMQGIAAAQALGEGPLHHHLEFEARAGLATTVCGTWALTLMPWTALPWR